MPKPSRKPSHDKSKEERQELQPPQEEFVTREIRVHWTADQYLSEESRQLHYPKVAGYMAALLEDRVRKLTGDDSGPALWFPDSRLRDIAFFQSSEQASKEKKSQMEEHTSKPGGIPKDIEQDAEEALRELGLL